MTPEDKPLPDKIPKRHKKQGIYEDKGYKVPANDELLKTPRCALIMR